MGKAYDMFCFREFCFGRKKSRLKLKRAMHVLIRREILFLYKRLSTLLFYYAQKKCTTAIIVVEATCSIQCVRRDSEMCTAYGRTRSCFTQQGSTDLQYVHLWHWPQGGDLWIRAVHGRTTSETDEIRFRREILFLNKRLSTLLFYYAQKKMHDSYYIVVEATSPRHCVRRDSPSPLTEPPHSPRVYIY